MFYLDDEAIKGTLADANKDTLADVINGNLKNVNKQAEKKKHEFIFCIFRVQVKL